MTRPRLLAIFVTLVSILPASPALADTVGDHLEQASGAEFSGEQVVTCHTPDGVKSAVYELRQLDGKLYVSVAVGGSTTVVVGGGSYEVRNADGTVQVTRVEGAAAVDIGVRYDSANGEPETYLGREVIPVDIFQGALRRAQMTFDAESGALLRTQVYNGDGSLYCESRFLSFEAGEPVVDASAADGATALATASDEDLPAKVAGFTQLDIYAFNRDATMAYYSDGLFSFTLLHSDRPVEVKEAAKAPVVKLPQGDYRRLFGAGQVVYVWESEVGGFALFGDLPLDMQQQVLSKLPPPRRPNVIERIIQALFD